MKDGITLMIQEHIEYRDLSGMPDSDGSIHIDQIEWFFMIYMIYFIIWNQQL